PTMSLIPSSVINSTSLNAPWPILDQAPPVPPQIINTIMNEANGTTFSCLTGYFSLGFFYIQTGLLEPHPTQRPLSHSHVISLKNDFDTKGVNRTDNPGVVIGLGQGWNHLKNNSGEVYRIDTTCPHLHLLTQPGNMNIGQIIRGNHR